MIRTTTTVPSSGKWITRSAYWKIAQANRSTSLACRAEAMRVLMLGPWSIARPRHGGQIRADRIAAAYRSRGHEVTFAGIVDPNNVPSADMGPHDVAIDLRVVEFISRAKLPLHMS